MRMGHRVVILSAGLVWLGAAGFAEALTGLDGRWYPDYRPATVRWVQQALKAANAYTGPVNGKLDPASMEALKGFQTRAGVHPSGVPTPLTRRALRAAAPGVKAPAEPAYQGVGTVAQQAGELRITRANPPSRRRPQEFQRRIGANDVIETGGNGKAVIALDDGSTMVLGSNTRVQVKDLVSAPAERETSVLVEATRGVLRFATRLVSDAATDIRVQAPTAFAAVRGTDWMMRIAPDTTSVFVEEGSVAVTNIGPNVKQVVVTQGQGTDVDRGKQPTDPAPWAYNRVNDLRKQTDYP